MKKRLNIITYHCFVKYNFGGPSILFGLLELFKQTAFDINLIHYSSEKLTAQDKKEWLSYPIEFKYIPNNIDFFDIMKSVVEQKSGKESQFRELLLDFERCDIIIDLYGICYCEKLINNYNTYLHDSIKEYWGAILGRIYNKPVIKNIASYGPLNDNKIKWISKFFSKYLFNAMIAREEESAKVIKELYPAKVRVCPDIANLMPYDEIRYNEEKYIIVSVSHQIIKQWQNSFLYYDTIVKLIEHVRCRCNLDVLLLPNEYMSVGDSDLKIAKKICNMQESRGYKISEIINVEKLHTLEIKGIIAKSEMVIASRYHSCVATLSAGIPLFVLGWHYKYEELLEQYNQKDCIISNSNIDYASIVKKFDEIWNQRQERKECILRRKKLVDRNIIRTMNYYIRKSIGGK